MFCPNCKTEYVEGVTTCADCGVPLVANLPAEEVEPPRWVEFEEILSTFNAGDIALIKSILDGEEISYYFRGEAFNYVEPLVQPAKLMVEKEQAEQVREILGDLSLDYTLKGNAEKSTED